MKNIAYKTTRLARFYEQNRIAWSQFYESERVITERLALGPDAEVLDIGCGCGGLGLALRERFGVRHYTGVDINQAAADAGRAMNADAQILCGDILDLSTNDLRERLFDVVFSLGCVDWNVRFADMLAAAWNHVRPGGHLVSTFRLIDTHEGDDISRFHQYINFDGMKEGERAPYVVLNARALLVRLAEFRPSAITAYGYWGTPSATAVVPYERLCFAAFSVQKRRTIDTAPLRSDLKLPAEIQAALDPLRQ